ncbi:MAG: TlpA family protein disulfide reductase [Lachnospiraceae bacterium]|nr:TlpA family protein disulfide reductase [Lachnospiraceae bacterium]
MDSKKKKLVLLTLILAFVALLISAYVIYERLGETVKPNQLEGQEHKESQADAPEKEKAYDFTVYDIEGNEVHLSDYLGTPIVLNFWASWCGPCQREMPDFQEKYLEWGNEIQFLMVNMTDGSRETVDIASAFIEEQEYTFPVFYDTEYDAANTYGVYSLPMTVLIDSEGYIAGYASGAIDGETLQIGIDMIKE